MRGRVRLASTAISICFLVSLAAAQQTGSTSGKGTAIRLPSRNPTNAPTGTQPPIFYAGKVMLDTGIAPSTPVPILRVCNGLGRRETYTAADGSFSFMLGDRYSEVPVDASDTTRGSGADTQYSRNSMGANQSNPLTVVSDCEIRAELSGYTSTSIRLDPSMNNSIVGIIMLHSRTKKPDGMVTVASLEVPAKARRDFEKGSEQLEKGNLNEAEKSLRKAIDQYPKFAEAWNRLGDLEQHRKNTDAAMNDYQEAINSDPNLPLPYLHMAFLEAVARNWEQTRKLTEKLISLDAMDFPLAYYYNAVAEFNLNSVTKAESSALRAESMDKQHVEPRIELLLASIYVAKESYPVAADHYRQFLKLAPDSPLSARVKTDLAKIEELAKSQAPAAPANK